MSARLALACAIEDAGIERSESERDASEIYLPLPHGWGFVG